MSKYVTKILINCVLFVGGVFAFSIASAAYAQSPSISINGERIEIPSNVEPPVIINGRALVPMYPVMEQLGFLVATRWDGPRTVILSRPEHSVVIGIGRHRLLYREEGIDMGATAQIINGHVMLPIRAIAETTGLQVRWNSSTFTVEIIGTIPHRDPVPTLQQEMGGISITTTHEELMNYFAQTGRNIPRRSRGADVDSFSYDTGSVLFLFDDFGTLESIINIEYTDLLTDKGIGLGDSRERVIELYGNHFWSCPFGTEDIEYFDGETYLFFQIFDNIVIRWGIGLVTMHDIVLRHAYGL